MTTRDDLKQMFFDEAQDLLETLAEGMQRLEEDEGDVENVHAIFRAVHSIKGGAGAFGLADLVSFAHLFETVLDGLRSGRLCGRQGLMPILLRAGDCLSDLVQAARDDVPAGGQQLAQSLAELEALTGEGEAEEEISFTPVMLDFAFEAEDATPQGYVIRFAPAKNCYTTGNEPTPLFRTLAHLGALEAVPDLSGVKPLEILDLDAPGLRWMLSLRTERREAELRQVFEFVADLCDLSIEEIAEARPELAAEDTAQEVLTESPPQMVVTSAVGNPADDPPARPQRRDDLSQQASIRVGLDRVDRLLNLVGEMVVSEAMLTRAVADAGLRRDGNVTVGLDAIRNLTAAIQDCVMAIRAQPLKPLFQRMQRITREAAEAAGKQVRLVTQGDWTEVDKTVVERLADPLTHMIRNSVDHGIEAPERRRTVGKPDEGTITLSAAHRSGKVVIEVCDDGGGIDRPRVQAIAAERGLVPAEAQLSAAEVDNLLFLPGFSSKKEVSALSGRGVGLDVVRREIQALGGRVGITSHAGQGTQFTIALPLTLAVQEGMLVSFGGQTMVVPLQSVTETVPISSADIHSIGATAQFVNRGGAMLSIIPLGRIFGLRETEERNRVLLFIEGEGGRRAAFAVDRIVDQRQVVIKPLEDSVGRLPGIAAATIMGDGRIALIIDPDSVFDMAFSEPATLSA